MPDRYIRSVAGPPGARRCACPTATSVPWRGHPARAALPLREKRVPVPPARAALSHNSPEPPRPAVHSGAAPLHNNPRRPAAQPPLHGYPATGHEMAGKPAWQPPAGPPSPAPSCIKPPGHQRAPPSPSGKSAYQFPRLAPPSRITPRNRRPPPSSRIPPPEPPPPAVLSHNSPELPRPAVHNGAAPLTAIPGGRRRNPRFTATPRPVTKWRANRHGSHPPGRRPLRPLA